MFSNVLSFDPGSDTVYEIMTLCPREELSQL